MFELDETPKSDIRQGPITISISLPKSQTVSIPCSLFDAENGQCHDLPAEEKQNKLPNKKHPKDFASVFFWHVYLFVSV